MSAFSPFTQALQIGRPRQRYGGGGGNMPQMGWIGDHSADDMNNPAMRLQMAQSLAAAKGQAATSEQGFGGVSPIQRAITQAKGAMLSGAGDIDDDTEKSQFETLRDNPDVDLGSFQKVLAMRNSSARANRVKPGPTQHDFGQTEDQGGDMPISKGAFAGQTLKPGDAVVGDQVSLGNGSSQQSAPDPVVQMVQAFKGQVPDEGLMAAQHAINSGVPISDVYNHLQMAAQQGTRQASAAQSTESKQAMQAKRKRVSDLNKQNQDLMKAHYGFAGANSEADFQGNDPDTVAERGAYQQMQTNRKEIEGLNGELEQGYDQPRPSGPTPAAAQGGRGGGGRYTLGQTIPTPKGPVKVVGFDTDGHPLITPVGR